MKNAGGVAVTEGQRQLSVIIKRDKSSQVRAALDRLYTAKTRLYLVVRCSPGTAPVVHQLHRLCRITVPDGVAKRDRDREVGGIVL